MEPQHGLSAGKLSDSELERQGTRAHATRNWVFLHGTADQFRHHTERMLELEREYLRRYPKRTWQGAAGDAATPSGIDRVEQIRQVLRSFQTQMEGLLAELAEAQAAVTTSAPRTDPVAAEVRFLARFADEPDGRMHKLEAHQAARELGLHAADVARLYKQDPPLLATAGAHRFLTDAGRLRLVARKWIRETPARWDRGKAKAFGELRPDIFGIGSHTDGAALGDEWWRVEDGSGVVGYGRLDETWGDAEILIVVDPASHGRGIGAFILDHLQQEAAARHLNYIYNVVPAGHPQQGTVSAWLRGHGFHEKADGELRKQVPKSDPRKGPTRTRNWT